MNGVDIVVTHLVEASDDFVDGATLRDGSSSFAHIITHTAMKSINPTKAPPPGSIKQ